MDLKDKRLPDGPEWRIVSRDPSMARPGKAPEPMLKELDLGGHRKLLLMKKTRTGPWHVTLYGPGLPERTIELPEVPEPGKGESPWPAAQKIAEERAVARLRKEKSGVDAMLAALLAMPGPRAGG